MSDFYGLLLAVLFVIALVATLVHMGLLKIELKRPAQSNRNAPGPPAGNRHPQRSVSDPPSTSADSGE